MSRSRKGQVTNVIWVIVGLVIALTAWYYLTRGTSKFLYGQCWVDAKASLDNIQAALSNLAQPGSNVSIAFKLGNCVETIVFTDQQSFYETFRKAGTPVDSIFECSKGFNSMMIVVPVQEKRTGAYESLKEWLVDKKGFTKALKWGEQLIGLEETPYCKTLKDQSYAFEKPFVMQGPESGEQRYCITAKLAAGGVYSLSDPRTIKSEEECRPV